MLGCVNYKRNPMCPPFCPEINWFKNLIKSYEYAVILHDVIKFENSLTLWSERKVFQEKLLKEEQELKRKGHFFAVCFFSGFCSVCEENLCRHSECVRPSNGRVPICGTGIDIAEICFEKLHLKPDLCASYWKPLLKKEYTKRTVDQHLCLGLILY